MMMAKYRHGQALGPASFGCFGDMPVEGTGKRASQVPGIGLYLD
jgi:hypothetical protein